MCMCVHIYMCMTIVSKLLVKQSLASFPLLDIVMFMFALMSNDPLFLYHYMLSTVCYVSEFVTHFTTI